MLVKYAVCFLDVPELKTVPEEKSYLPSQQDTSQTENIAVPVRFIFLHWPFGMWCFRRKLKEILTILWRLGAICAVARQKYWVKILRKIAATCWQRTVQPHILSETGVLLFIQLIECQASTLSYSNRSISLISSIKASLTAVKDVPLQLYADQTSSLENRTLSSQITPSAFPWMCGREWEREMTGHTRQRSLFPTILVFS